MNLPTLFRVSLALVAVSFILFFAGFGSNFWFVDAVDATFHFGLWAICRRGTCYPYEKFFITTPAHAYLGRFCTIFQMVSVVVAIVFLLLFAFKSSRPQWVRTSYSMLLTAGIVGLFGSVIFIGREKALDTTGTATVSWSGVLVILSGLMQIAAAVLVILPVRRGQVTFDA